MLAQSHVRSLLLTSGVVVIACFCASGEDAPFSSIVVTPEQRALLDADPYITTATVEFEREIQLVEESQHAAKSKAIAKRLAIYEQRIKAFTQAGDFDRAAACKAAIQDLEAARSESPRPKKTSRFANHTYAIIDEPVTWNVAKSRCEKMGGHLVTLESTEETDWFKKLCHTKKSSPWIGATDEEVEGEWRWVNGREIPSRIKNNASTDNYLDSEHWLIFSEPDNKWHDAAGRRVFACECDD